MGISLCHNLGYKRIICESDFIEVVNYFIDRDPHRLHRHASFLLDIVASLGQFEVASLVHILREHNKCVDFLAKVGAHGSIAAH